MSKQIPVQWSRLDNAAKIFPSTSSKKDTKVFRFACELKEKIEPTILQKALNKTVELFPLYKCILRRGLFWYYLEESDIQPFVQEEADTPCSPIYYKNKKTLLFEVTYYRNRINLEVYHALTDGTGALQFLKILVYYYIIFKYPENFQELPSLDYDASLFEKMDDSFQKYYSKGKSEHKIFPSKAYHIQGTKSPEHRLNVIEGILSVKSILTLAKKYNTTVTVLLTSLLILSIHKERSIRSYHLPVVLTVPVNLRKYFQSGSARNFFGTINISYQFDSTEVSLEEMIIYVADYFKKELTQEKVEQRMNELAALEHNIFARLVPLFIKDISLQIANAFFERSVTTALSNIGQIIMPEEFSPYISFFDVFVSTRRLQICMCSYKDIMTISFTSPFISSNIQKRFFRTLTDMGIEIMIDSTKS